MTSKRRRLLILESLERRVTPSEIGPSVIDPSTLPVTPVLPGSQPLAPPPAPAPGPTGDYPAPNPGLT